jgi:hypothetical protein
MSARHNTEVVNNSQIGQPASRRIDSKEDSNEKLIKMP